MSLRVGTVIEMTRDAPNTNVYKGDIGTIIKDVNSIYYVIHFVNETKEDICVLHSYVKEYHYKLGDRVEIVSPTSKYKGYYATVFREGRGNGYCSQYVDLFVDGTQYQPSQNFDQNQKEKCLKLVKSSVKPININNKKGENKMKLTGFNKVAVIEHGTLNLHYALYDDDIQVGDYVLVTGKLCSQIHKVKNIITLDEAREVYKDDIIAEVKCKVDLTAYDQRVKNRIEAEKLRQKMDAEIKKMDELNKYEMYADRNPALKEMLEQLKNLGV